LDKIIPHSRHLYSINIGNYIKFNTNLILVKVVNPKQMVIL